MLYGLLGIIYLKSRAQCLNQCIIKGCPSEPKVHTFFHFLSYEVGNGLICIIKVFGYRYKV